MKGRKRKVKKKSTVFLENKQKKFCCFWKAWKNGGNFSSKHSAVFQKNSGIFFLLFTCAPSYLAVRIPDLFSTTFSSVLRQNELLMLPRQQNPASPFEDMCNIISSSLHVQSRKNQELKKLLLFLETVEKILLFSGKTAEIFLYLPFTSAPS